MSVVDFLFVIIEFFTIFYGLDVISANLSKLVFFEWGWVTFSEYFRGKGASPTNHCWCQKTMSDCFFVWYQNIRSASFRFVTIHASDRQMDRQTDRQNCNRNTVHCISCSRTVKTSGGFCFCYCFFGVAMEAETGMAIHSQH